MRSRFRRNQRQQSPELNITAFMNLMVILVPFLLITAVFNQVNILEMNLPEQGAEQEQSEPEPPPLQLEIILRQDQLVVGDRPGSVLRTIPLKTEDDGYDLEALKALLRELKARHPDETVATLLLEPEVPYERLIQVMDTTRLIEIERDGQTVQAELFPDIALGDAPVAEGAR